MNKLLLLAILFISISNISASCSSGQIDINTASAVELEDLDGIGPAYAQRIIDSRPFVSVDSLIDVKGIGNVTLANIKSQGLACVDEEENADSGTEVNINISVQANVSNNNNYSRLEDSSSNKSFELQEISLNPKAIKTGENSQFSDKGDYTLYGLFAFGILLGLLFLIKRKKYKNEFR